MEGVGLLIHRRRPSNKEGGGGGSGWPFRIDNNRKLNAKENARAAGCLRAMECIRGEASVSVVRNLSRGIHSFQNCFILGFTACTTTCRCSAHTTWLLT